MSIFSRLFKRESEPLTPEIDPTLLQAILGNDEVTKEEEAEAEYSSLRTMLSHQKTLSLC